MFLLEKLLLFSSPPVKPKAFSTAGRKEAYKAIGTGHKLAAKIKLRVSLSGRPAGLLPKHVRAIDLQPQAGSSRVDASLQPQHLWLWGRTQLEVSHCCNRL